MDSYAKIVGATPSVAARQLISRGFRVWAEESNDPQLAEVLEAVRARSLDDEPSVPSMAAIEAAFDLAEAVAEEPGALQAAPADVTLEESPLTVEAILADAERSGAPLDPASCGLSAEELSWIIELRLAGGHDVLLPRAQVTFRERVKP